MFDPLKKSLGLVWKILTDSLKSLLKDELKSPAGKVNLIGGIIFAGMAILLLFANATTVVMNFIFHFFDIEPLDVPGIGYFFVAIVLLLVYFYLCVRVVAENE